MLVHMINLLFNWKYRNKTLAEFQSSLLFACKWSNAEVSLRSLTHVGVLHKVKLHKQNSAVEWELVVINIRRKKFKENFVTAPVKSVIQVRAKQEGK